MLNRMPPPPLVAYWALLKVLGFLRILKVLTTPPTSAWKRELGSQLAFPRRSRWRRQHLQDSQKPEHLEQRPIRDQGRRRHPVQHERRNLQGFPPDHHQLLERWRWTLLVRPSAGSGCGRQRQPEPDAFRRYRGWFR